MALKLTAQNYTKGFLVDDETIAGVTLMGEEAQAAVYAAYISHAATGETLAFAEFDSVEKALAFLEARSRPWTYEAVGCAPKAHSHGETSGGCGSCSSGGCGAR